MAAASMTALAYAQNGFGLPLDFVKHTTTPDYYNEGRTARAKPNLPHAVPPSSKH